MLEFISGLGVVGIILVLLVAVSPLLSYLELRKIRRKLEQIDYDIHYGILKNEKPIQPPYTNNNYFK